MSARMAESGLRRSDFSTLLLEVRSGGAPFESILEHYEFLNRARHMCLRICRRRDASYDAEDLFEDACVKMLKHKESFIRGDRSLREQWLAPEKQAEKHFFDWFTIIAVNIFRSRLRKVNKRDALRLPVVLVPIEECGPIEDSGVNLEREHLLREFREFIDNSMPRAGRRAVELWLEGLTSREMEGKLNGEGIKCTHATAQNWVNDGLKAFKKSMRLDDR